MFFHSTSRCAAPVSFREAVLGGVAPDGGLWIPERLPNLPASFFARLPHLSLQEIAFEIATIFAEDDVAPEDLRAIVNSAINFDAPLLALGETLFVLELFHGPTLAFKDFGARFMAHLIRHFLQEFDRSAVILVATSGDTGSAVAHAFYGMSGIQVVLLYPSGQVSEIQEKQMTTLGANVSALKISGTFDDCQSLVKRAFADSRLKSNLISANSINIARLIPQSFYYFYAVSRLRGSGPIVFSVPSGNFGNLTAGLYAKRMGLSVDRFIAATNANDTVPDYLDTGIFQPRISIRTISNAMDVGNPSNFARIDALYGSDVIPMRQDIQGCAFTDDQTKSAMKELDEKYGYICDPHTAVAYLGLKSFAKGETQAGIFLATAHPAKFPDLLQRQVEIPERLQHCFDKPGNSIPMTNNFQELKDFLIGL
jgi:threonine synthase